MVWQSPPSSLSSRLFFIALYHLICCPADASHQLQTTHPASNPEITENADHAAMLGRIEASIMGESALIDRETGRVFWEGGSSLTLYESMVPKFESYGLEHALSTVLSAVLLLGIVSLLVTWIRHNSSNGSSSSTHPILASILWSAATWTPNVEISQWVLLAVITLYFFESYNCPTRRFLTHAISSSSELEDYVESLRREHPIVQWKVKCFHYERRSFRSLYSLLVSSFRRQKISSTNNSTTAATTTSDTVVVDDNIIPPSKNSPPIFLLTKKVVTHQATATYQYQSCLDSTMAGVWKRAAATSTGTPPFTKIALTKLLVLSNRKSREDYFRQQSEFVTAHGRDDEFVEFSTDIQVAGYKPRMLAVRPVHGIHSAKLFRLYLFWIFTLVGLSVPYRIWFARHCDCLRVTVVKETSSDPVSEPWFPSLSSLLESTLSPSSPGVTGEKQFRAFMRGVSLYNEKE